MARFKWLVVVVLLFVALPGFANDSKLVGAWRIISWETEYQATGAKEAIMGKSPSGSAIYTSGGRFMILVTGEGRKTPATDQDRAQLWKTMLATSGTYRVEGDKLTLGVEASSIPGLVGEHTDYFRIDGDRLEMTTPWMDAPLNPERGKMRTIFTWERVK